MEDTPGMTWRKARASSNGGGNCVEVASDGHRVYTRDTTARERGHLAVTAAQWRAFIATLKTGGFEGR